MAQSKNLFGSNINLVRSHNVRAVLLSLLHNGPISRVELAEKLSLSNTTITNKISELLEDGIIHEQQFEVPGKQKRVGRPLKMLHLDTAARFAIGVHIGVGLNRVAITNLCGEIIYNEIETFDLATPPETVIEHIGRLIRSAIKRIKIDRERVIGVGLGASGLVNFDQGINVLALRRGWENVPIKHLMEDQLDLPVCRQQCRTMALAEAFFGEGRGASILAFVYGRNGVGSGIVVNGQVFQGSGAGAGEIRHTTIIPRGLT